MNDPMTLKRPKANEDEDDLLRMQEEFLKSNITPSVNISYLNKDNNQNRFQRPRVSKFSLSKKLKSNSQVEENIQTFKGPEHVSLNPYNSLPEDREVSLPNTSSSIIIGNIVERKTSQQFLPEFSKESNSASLTSGFPSIFVSKDSKTNKEGSLFLQAISKSKKTSQEEKVETPEVSFKDYGLLTEEDILREKRKLESTLNPSLIQFIKQRKKEKDSLKQSQLKDKSVQSKNENELKSNVEEPQTSLSSSDPSVENQLPEMVQEIFEEAKKQNWVHMDVVEEEKAKWMEDVKDKEEKVDLNEQYNARFDFNGVLLPFNDTEITIDKGLHHHGEEPERPGYSLQELLQLSRSSSLQQRSIALQTLANIIEKSRRGWYDSVLSPAPLSALNEKNVFLLLRFSIDDSSPNVVTAALQAMRAFLYNEEDEVCLDRLFGLNEFAEPILKPDLKDVKDISILKDHELAQLDTVATALRSDIIPRIRYILNEMQPPPDGVSSALEILIRLTRHSQETALNILSVPHLLEIILKHFVPLTTNKLINQKRINNAYGIPVVSALRFCRVLITYAGKPAAIKLCRLHIVESLLSYISSEAGSHETFLHIECLRLWKLLLLHGFATDSLSGSQIIIKSQLRIFFDNLNIGQASELFCEHAAALISVAGHEDTLRPDILLALKKWSTQLANVSSPTWGNTKLVFQALLAVEDFSEGYFQSNWISNTKIFERLCSTSNLLSGFVIAKGRSPSSLPSLGALTENGQLQPVLSQNSCLPFISQALQVFSIFSHKNEIETIYNRTEFLKYISALSTYEWSLDNSWYSRIELHFLTRVIKTAKIVEETLPPKTKNILWLLTIKLLSALPADSWSQVKEMLHCVLDPNKLSLEELLKNLQNLKLNENVGQSTCLNLSKELITVYENYIPRKGNWDQAALPRDWIFLPLIDTYRNVKNCHEIKKSDAEKIIIVLNLYLGLPELVQSLTPTLQFSRLILVFLCETVFNDKTVSPLLEKVVLVFLKKHNKELDFTKEVPGLSSFTDMFTALCENFFSHSYGNNYFAIILLAFNAQKHDVHYRKMLWSEHAGTLRYIKITADKLILPLDEFLYPIETDVSLIECYVTSLVREIVKKEWCSIPYIIALHHSAMFLKSPNKLAIRMKSGLEKLKDSRIANTILNYDPTMLENFI